MDERACHQATDADGGQTLRSGPPGPAIDGFCGKTKSKSLASEHADLSCIGALARKFPVQALAGRDLVATSPDDAFQPDPMRRRAGPSGG
jgi:hypothetical protein